MVVFGWVDSHHRIVTHIAVCHSLETVLGGLFESTRFLSSRGMGWRWWVESVIMKMRLVGFIVSIVLFYVSVHFTHASVSIVMDYVVESKIATKSIWYHSCTDQWMDSWIASKTRFIWWTHFFSSISSYGTTPSNCQANSSDQPTHSQTRPIATVRYSQSNRHTLHPWLHSHPKHTSGCGSVHHRRRM